MLPATRSNRTLGRCSIHALLASCTIILLVSSISFSHLALGTAALPSSDTSTSICISAGFLHRGSEHGWVQDEEYSCLYGWLSGSAGVTIAKLLTAAVEDPSAYSFWVGIEYRSTAPSIDDTTAAIFNARSTRQSTFYTVRTSRPTSESASAPLGAMPTFW